MIFTADLAKLVLRGAKTETRRLVKPGDVECRYRPQHTYAIQRTPTSQDRRDGFAGRAKTIDDVRLLVTDVHTERLTELDHAGATREGFPTLAAFADTWMRLHESGWPPREEQLCDHCDGHAVRDNEPCQYCDLGTVMRDQVVDPGMVLERFLQRHANTVVWVIRFELEQDPVRLLTPSGRPHGSELGYTTERFVAMTDEPETIDPARLHPDWQTRSRAHHVAALRSTDGARLAGLRSDEERLEEFKRIAAERKVDIRNDVDVIRHRISAIERKIRDKTDGRAA